MVEWYSKSRCRWLQFSLRSLLAIMLIVAAFLAGRISVQPELERLRTAVLEVHGGEVYRSAAGVADDAAVHPIC